MGLPGGFKKKIGIVKEKVGFERRQELLDDIDNRGTFLPKGVNYEDMDKTFLEFVNEELKISLDGETVPVIFLTIQRWSEFTKTWQFTDKFGDIQIPFITVVRKPDVQVGTNQAGNWNIPGGRGYTYVKVPTFEGGRKGIDLYKIPQPTSVDLTYEVRLFCNRMTHLNMLHKVVQKIFNSRQHYIYPKQHPMPLHLETISDESQIDNLEGRRFYVQFFEIKLLGYILDEEDFVVIPTPSRIRVGETIEGGVRKNKKDSDVIYNVEFNNILENSVTIINVYNSIIFEITNLINVDSVSFRLNGEIIELPFSTNSNDNIEILITRIDNTLSSSLTLKGVRS